MREGNGPIYLDKDGYEQYLEELEELKRKLNRNGQQKSSAYVSAVGDGWHDNFEFEEATREEYKILSDLREKMAGLRRIVIVEKNESDNKIANINDLILVSMFFGSRESSDEIFKLVASSSPNIFADIREISINSPLGKAVYQQPEGYSGEYSVNNNTIHFELKKVGKTLEELQDDSLKLTRG